MSKRFNKDLFSSRAYTKIMSNHCLTAAYPWNAKDKIEGKKLAAFVIMEDGDTAKEHGFNSLRNFGLRYLNLKDSEYYFFGAE